MTFSYRRIPVLTRLYEAISLKYLSEFDKIIIRFYDPNCEEPTTSIESRDNETEGLISGSASEQKISVTIENTTPDAEKPSITGDDSIDIVVDQELADTIQSAIDNDSRVKKTSAKKQTAASIKVRQMKIKSKAHGDCKRLKLVEQRFFVELVLVGRGINCAISPVFTGKEDTFERLVRDCILTLPSLSKLTNPQNNEFELLTPTSSPSSFRRIHDMTMSLKEAESKQILSNFDTLIIRYTSE